MEKYSVLMSVYIKENPEYLRQSLESMICQTVAPDEIILVEDGPLNDELYETIWEFETEYPDLFKIIKLEKNGGLGNALNHGIIEARNELIARMDSDDISLPERCEKQLRAFERHPDLAIVGAQINEFTGTTDNIVASRRVPASYREIKKFARRRSPFNHPSVMYRKSAIISSGGYGRYRRKEDLDLFIRMVNEGYKAINLKNVYLLYRVNPGNVRRRKEWNNCREYIEIMYKFHKKGWNSIIDMLYVTAGQLVMYLAPTGIIKRLSGMFLREKPVSN